MNIQVLKNLKWYIIEAKHYFFFCNECDNNDDKTISEEEEVIAKFKVFGLIDNINE